MSQEVKGPKIIVAALNWGLGHATRCIPIINELLNQKAEVILASDGRAYELFKSEFPELKIYQLAPYDVTYAKEQMVLNIAGQLPVILLGIYKEHKALLKIIQQEGINGIISDNRFGCYHPKVYSIFLTHQLNIKIPLRPIEMFTRLINRKVIDRFHECWIPDYPGKENISGELSIPKKIKNPIFIGPLTRFKYKTTKKKYDVIALLSGPEPQRTVLEKIIIDQASNLDIKTIIVQGKTEKFEHIKKGNLEIVSFLKAKELNEAILSSEIVICRSGYSTIMDLLAIHKKAIMIPTPGQTEQEYLAESFHKRKIFYTVNQKEFKLSEALLRINDFDPNNFHPFEFTPLSNTITEFLAKLTVKH